MSDEQDTDRPDTPADVPPSSRPGAARSSTSRARRIGGRPVTPSAPPRPATDAATTDPTTSEATTEAAGAVGSPVRVDKPSGAGAAATGDSAVDETEAVRGRAAGDRPSVLPWVPAAVLGVAAVVLAVLVTVFAVKGHSTSAATPTLSAADTAVRQQVLAAAKGCVVRVNSYDYRTFPADEQQALKCTTGQYTADFKKTFEGVIMKFGPKLKATQTAQIDLAGIQQVSPDGKQWTLLLFGQLTATNNSSAKSGRVDPLAIKVVMQKVGSQWLIGKLAGA